jgi:hypothetical protein
MVRIIAAALLVLANFAISIPAASAGPCDHSWQTAKDGSSCGGRAADQRPGGN